MARSSNGDSKSKSNGVASRKGSLVAKRGAVNTGDDMKGWMSDLMCDLASDRVRPDKGNAICSAARNILATVALEYKFASSGGKAPRPAKLRLSA